jgi:hypothetical protein
MNKKQYEELKRHLRDIKELQKQIVTELSSTLNEILREIKNRGEDNYDEPVVVKSARTLAKLHEPDYPKDLETNVGGYRFHLFINKAGEHVAYLDLDGKRIKVYSK